MRWIITQDHIETNSVGVGEDENGNRVRTSPNEGDGLTYDFKLYDDDGELYYEGLSGDIMEDEERAFAPLEWGMQMAGCTTMTYRVHGSSKEEWLHL